MKVFGPFFRLPNDKPTRFNRKYTAVDLALTIIYAQLIRRHLINPMLRKHYKRNT